VAALHARLIDLDEVVADSLRAVFGQHDSVGFDDDDPGDPTVGHGVHVAGD